MDGEDTGFAPEVTEFTVGITGEDFAAVATEELYGGGGFKSTEVVYRGSDHACDFVECG